MLRIAKTLRRISEQSLTRPRVDRQPARPAIDRAVALTLAGLTLLDPLIGKEPETSVAYTVALATVLGSLMLLRGWHPFVLLGVLLSGAVASLLVDTLVLPVLAGALITLFTIATVYPRRVAILAGAVTAATVFTMARASTDSDVLSAESLIAVVWTALAVAIGDAVRTRRIYIEVLEERARRAEETREQEAKTRVAEERLRIAQELHDIVAHHIAVVNIQAGLASRALTREAYDIAATAIDRVSDAARSALDDLSAVLRLLRAPDDTGSREPAPGLAQVNDLIQSYANHDDRVHWTIRGRAVALDAASELTAYRVIQEALTNAAKHGAPGDTRLTIAYQTDNLAVTVSNPVRTDGQRPFPTVPGTGLGVIGLRERVGSVGGSVMVGQRPDGLFVVQAVIPYAPARRTRMGQTS